MWWLVNEREYYLRGMMKEGVHYLATDGLFRNLTQVVRWAQQHDKEMQQMARAGMELAKNVFSRQGLIYYTSLLLKNWSRRMAFTPKLEHGAYRFLPDHEYDTCLYRPSLFERVFPEDEPLPPAND